VGRARPRRPARRGRASEIVHLSGVVAGLVLLGFLCQWLSWRTRIPAILYLLLAGLALGPVSGLVDPEALFGDLFFPMVELGVAIILFEGSLTLRFREIRSLAPAILLLVTVGAALTVAGLAAAAYFLTSLPWSLALLFGALNCVSGPTVIAPLLRSVRPTERVAKLLRWEGIIIDPIGALLALLAFDAIVFGSQQHSDELLLITVAAGSVMGLAGGFAVAAALRRRWVPEFLDNFLVLAAVLATFSLANVMAHESGLIAVTIMGITLANVRDLDVEHILNFKENLSILLISMMFVVLSARVALPSGTDLVAGAFILLIAILVVRPVAVFVSTLFSPLTWPERAMVAYVAPRGIVAAAISALFALRLQEQGFAEAGQLVSLTFMIIIGTVLLQSFTAGRVARRLGVAEEDPRGVLIVGAGEIPRMIASALKRQDVPVLIADDDWEDVRACRMEGLPTYYGNPVSQHAEANLPVESMRWLLAMSTRVEINSLACMRYRPELGKDHVLRLRLFGAGEAPRMAHAGALQAPALFGNELTHARLLERLAGHRAGRAS